MLAFVFPYQAKRLALGERLQNDLFCVEWDVKLQLSQSVSSRQEPYGDSWQGTYHGPDALPVT